MSNQTKIGSAILLILSILRLHYRGKKYQCINHIPEVKAGEIHPRIYTARQKALQYSGEQTIKAGTWHGITGLTAANAKPSRNVSGMFPRRYITTRRQHCENILCEWENGVGLRRRACKTRAGSVNVTSRRGGGKTASDSGGGRVKPGPDP